MIKLKKIQINYKKIILDFIPAFLGVLVALVLSNWNEQRKENEFIEKSIVSIYNDNKSNLENIKLQLNNTNRQLDTITHYLNNDKLNIGDIIKKNNGINGEILVQTGWKILENSHLITKIDYDLVFKLDQMSEGIDIINTRLNNTFDFCYEKLESNKHEDKKRLLILFKDLKYASSNYRMASENLDSLIQTEYKKILSSI